MRLVRLIYASTIIRPYEGSTIEDILSSARNNNKLNDVTGLLCFNRKYFLQCLEGSRRAVNRIYGELMADPRHEDLVLLSYEDVDQRDFLQWEMGYVSENSITRELTLRYSSSSDFNPYDLNKESVHRLLLSLRDHVPVI